MSTLYRGMERKQFEALQDQVYIEFTKRCPYNLCKMWKKSEKGVDLAIILMKNVRFNAQMNVK